MWIWLMNGIACKSLAFGSWFTSFSRVLPTSHMVYHSGKPIKSVVYCLIKQKSCLYCSCLLPRWVVRTSVPVKGGINHFFLLWKLKTGVYKLHWKTIIIPNSTVLVSHCSDKKFCFLSIWIAKLESINSRCVW